MKLILINFVSLLPSPFWIIESAQKITIDWIRNVQRHGDLNADIHDLNAVLW